MIVESEHSLEFAQTVFEWEFLVKCLEVNRELSLLFLARPILFIIWF